MVEAYKAQFIDFLLGREVLKIGGPYTLKSGRQSPYFLKLDDVNDGAGLSALGDSYAETILANLRSEDFDGVVGIPSKCHTFGPAVTLALAKRNASKPYSSWREKPKTYGDATALGAVGRDQRQNELILGAHIQKGSRQVLVDDVMTAGDAKEGALEMIKFLAEDVVVPALVIAANRQEIDKRGENAVEQFTRKHAVPIYYPITAGDIYSHLKETGRISPEDERAFLAYLLAWGTPDVRQKYNLVNEHLIEGKCVIPACDISDIERFEKIIRETADAPGIGGYKIGFELGLLHGLPRVVEIVRRYAPDKKVIYDHQKAGTDIPDTGMNFAKTMKKSGVDAAIIFPQAGPVTQVRWTGELLQHGVNVFIGGEMTHEGYKASDGGYLSDEAFERMYTLGANMGIVNFIVPGNKIDRIKIYRDLITGIGIDPAFGAPGFVAQGGKISDAARVAGDNWYAIVGRDIMNAEDVRSKAQELTSQLAA